MSQIETVEITNLAVDRVRASGPKVLFVHGANAGSWVWHKFLHQFAAAGYDSYALTLRGHPPNPATDSLGRLRIADYAHGVSGVVRQLGEVVLVGHSMGGAIAQAVAAQMPLRAVVLAATAPVAGVRFRPPPFSLELVVETLRALPKAARKQPYLPSEKLLRSAVLNRIPPAQQRPLLPRFVPESSMAARDIARGRARGDLARLDLPKLVIAGDEDRTTVIEMEREIAQRQAADLVELAGHGHLFMLEPGWQRCAEQIIDWLRSRGIE